MPLVTENQNTAARLQLIKAKILEFIGRNGPTLPVRLASVIEKDSMFVGAMLSELLASKQLKVTHAKVGGSRLYYLPSQENKLEVLFNHLPMREKEAYQLLKQRQYLNNNAIEPAIRVALTNLKDFAIPVERNGEITWRWHLAPDQVAQPQRIEPQKQVPAQEPRQQTVMQQLPSQSMPQQRKKSKDSSAFLENIHTFLKNRNIAILSTEKKNREHTSIIEVPSAIGTIPMLLIAKNKKLINENDLILAHSLGQSKKLPTLLITTGQLNKKAQIYREKNLRGLVVVHTI